MLTTKDLLRLQGLPENLIGTAKAAGVTDRQLRLAIGQCNVHECFGLCYAARLKAIGHA